MKALKRTAVMLSVMFTLVLGGAAPTIPANVDAHAKTTYVWIAPNHGKKWHHSKHCRGLSNAKSKKHVTLKWARHHGYRMCKWCY
ncbi:hypothetical protein YK48G_04500 [Lentilactobacillus fungorum]|uniref:Uncharacterized protein n=1 Tax=Lentilactobacillus fungorum TaxID=2201250 RepID=A0ABQ3VVV7_9LACO|nr:hypothetical protein YK48G_04500 [Lentilactobacillus fungorum]